MLCGGFLARPGLASPWLQGMMSGLGEEKRCCSPLSPAAPPRPAFSHRTRQHMMLNRMTETSRMAEPTPINTPSTGEMISLVLRDPILAAWSVISPPTTRLLGLAGVAVCSSTASLEPLHSPGYSDTPVPAYLELVAVTARVRLVSAGSPFTTHTGTARPVRLASSRAPANTVSRNTDNKSTHQSTKHTTHTIPQYIL